jgi:energy-coupling factor transporter ATP-binding protein EcfA2
VATDAEPELIVLPWPDFQRMFFRAHKQGEHVAGVGPTGSGKTTCLLELAKIVGLRKGRDGRPARVVVLGNKPRDDTLMRLHREGWPIVKEWPPSYGEEHCIVWPRGGPASQESARLRTVYGPLLDAIYQEGGQTVVIDEASYFEVAYPEGLGMSPVMGKFWSAGRSNKLTLIAGTQRPRNVTRLMWSEPSWLIIYPPEDVDDLKRVAELSGRKEEVMAIVPQLGPWEFLCVRRQRNRSRALYVSRVPKPPKQRTRK